jgi:acylphosphatase
MPNSRSVLVRISGRVQGVGYRDWTRRTANELGLSGWVRNLTGGEVEALLNGSTDTIDAMLTACQRGPRSARVDAVDVVETAETASGAFSVRHDR